MEATSPKSSGTIVLQMEDIMSMTYAELSSVEAPAYGGLVDAIGGIATAVLAIVALTGFAPETTAAIATIVFGAALLIQGGTILSEYAHLVFPADAALPSVDRFGGGGLSALFLVGIAGIVLGVLALLGIASAHLTAIAIIAFGSALIMSSNSVRQLYLLQTAMTKATGSHLGRDFLAGEMASGSASIQVVAGLAAIVLGILAVVGTSSTPVGLAALLVLGVTIILTGSTLSGLVLGLMRPAPKAT
jgi:hypothetical protein